MPKDYDELFLEISYGSDGLLFDLDRSEFMDPELLAEFSDDPKFLEFMEEFAQYVAERFEYYLGEIPEAADITRAWEDFTGTDQDEREGDDDRELDDFLDE